MRTILILFGLLAGAASMAYGADAPATGTGAERVAGRAPNIVLILADDLGYADLGCYGNAHVRTPNLDALAAQGIQFTDFHSNGPLCTPTRAALLTGRYQQRHGVDGVHGDGDLLPLSAVTIARRLRDDAGYATGIFGKWHLSGHDRSPEQYKGRMPGDFGFDEFRGFMGGFIDYASHLNPNGERDWWHNDRMIEEKGYASHLTVDHATRFIRAHRDRPFFVYLSFPDIHFPFMTPDDPPYYQPGEQYPRGDKEPKNRRFGPHDGSPDLQRVVHRMIGEMDTGVGRVIDTLKACGLDRDTFVFFTSDNGGYNDLGLNRGRISDMGPLSGQKGGLREGGHRVPAIAWHPGRVVPGKVCDATALTFDLHPTFLDLAGLNPPPPGSADALDGVSLRPLLFHGKPITERAVAWFFNQGRALRKGPWKLIQNGDGPPTLYNLAEDIGETTNRMSEFSTLGNALHKELQALERDVKGRNSSKGKGETLYNGIVLPEEWPPRDQDPASAEPMRVPYLEKPPTVIPVDVGRQLFVDDFLIESTDLTRTFHTAKKHEGNPVFKPETPAELKPAAVCYLGHGGVFYDPAERLVKMWYSAGELDGALAFATSRDGFTWERPYLGLPAGGNHLLPRGGRTPGTHAGGDNCLWLDTFTTNAAERLKFLVQRSMSDPHWLAVSADGRTWSDPVPAGRAGDYCSFFFNPFRNVWVYSVKRGGSRGRNRYYAESPVFLTEDAFNNAVYWCNADRLDEQDPEAKCPPQLYSLNAVAYESLLLGAFYIHLGPPNEVCKKDKFPKITEIKLGFSRDGFHWHRPDRRAFIPASRVEGSWDRAYVHSTAGVCLIDGDRLLFPYCAFSGIAPDGSRGMYHGGSVGMATLRRDGFASMAAGEAPGTLTTRPVTFAGKHLFVNVDAPEGSLRAEVLDADGKPIEPFTMANSIPFSGDSTIEELKWEGATDLSALAGQPVRFRFELTNGSLYAFWVSRDESGRSDGYLAAGGPGYTDPTDTVGRAALTKAIQAKDR